MSYENAVSFLKEQGFHHKIRTFDVSSATVEQAAKALACEEKQIAKTLSFCVNEHSILVVAAGDAKIDNAKYKKEFGAKAQMLPAPQVEACIGHPIGGVCPFGINKGVKVYLDISLQRFPKVYPACGSASSAVELTIQELEMLSLYEKWIDVCKGWQA